MSKELLVELVDLEDVWNEATEEDIIKNADVLGQDEYYIFIKATSREEAKEIVEEIFEDDDDSDAENLYSMNSELREKVSFIHAYEDGDNYISKEIINEYKQDGYSYVYHKFYNGNEMSDINDRYIINEVEILAWENEDGSKGYGLINQIKERNEEER